jgi:glycine/D-amino acid oxidase-like deaminating enzyme
VSQLPRAVHRVVVGAGIHGLSTGWHLGLELSRRRGGSGRDVVVLDKTAVGAGAAGSHSPWE